MILLSGCGSLKPQPNPTHAISEEKKPTFSLPVVLEHIEQSYILGCAKAHKDMGLKNFYLKCQQLGREHSEEVKKIVLTKTEENSNENL
jgi:hypothetical protein